MAPDSGPSKTTSPSLSQQLGEVVAFSGIAAEELETLASEASRLQLREGQEVEARPLVVLTGGLRILDDEGRSVDVVAPGELWLPGEDEGGEAVLDGEVILLPDRAGDLAWSGVDVSSLIPPPQLRTPLSGPAEALMTPVSVLAPTASVAEAARELNDSRATAVIVDLPGGPGIVTDADIRSRLVAKGLSPETPVGEIATSPLFTTRIGSTLSDAVRVMVDAGVSHLPVMDSKRVVGILQATRVLSTVGADSMGVRGEVARAPIDDLRSIHDRFPGLAEDLLASGMDALSVLRVLSDLSDAMTTRLIELLKPPDTDFGWVALGSQGRHEQGLYTDQDHALVLGDGADETAFATWAAEIVEALERAGLPRCHGGTMASETEWRHTVKGWRRWQSQRLADAEPRSVLEVATMCDARVVTGSVGLGDVFDELRSEVGAVAPFMSRMAAGAIHFRVPLGFLGRLVVERTGDAAGRFDIKTGAVGPITVLVRVAGLAAGSRATRTLTRLEDAEAAGELSTELADILRHGLELALRLRLRRHLECWRENLEYDDQIDPDAMDAWERELLKEVFRAIREVQGAMEQRFQTGYVR